MSSSGMHDPQQQNAPDPERGYYRSSAFIPYTPPPPPPGRMPNRLWHGYHELRSRAQRQSLSWWWLKIVQGVVIALGLIVLSVLYWMFAELLDFPYVLTYGMDLLILVAGVVFLLHLAAPLIMKWKVTIPENHYFVLEDANGFTLDYLEPGRQTLIWGVNRRVKPYVDFNSVSFTQIYDDVINRNNLPLDIEVSVGMSFNPAEANEAQFAALRNMTTQDVFAGMLASSVGDMLRQQVAGMDFESVYTMQSAHQDLEDLICDQLEGFAGMGLFPRATRPVKVHVRMPDNVREAHQSLWARTARFREDSETLRDIQQTARELGIPFEQAFEKFFLMKYGMNPSPHHYPQIIADGMTPTYGYQTSTPLPGSQPAVQLDDPNATLRRPLADEIPPEESPGPEPSAPHAPIPAMNEDTEPDPQDARRFIIDNPPRRAQRPPTAIDPLDERDRQSARDEDEDRDLV